MNNTNIINNTKWIYVYKLLVNKTGLIYQEKNKTDVSNISKLRRNIFFENIILF